MAILFEDLLEGTPTSGAVDAANHAWITAADGSAEYTDDLVNGLRAISFGPSFGSLESPVADHGRARFVSQWSDEGQTANAFLFHVRDDSNVIRGQSTLRNSGEVVWARWNFNQTGETAAWPENTPWRFEYEWDGSVGSILLEVWEDPDADGEPDHTVLSTGTQHNITTAFFGANTNDGITRLMGGFAISDGERIGPVVQAGPTIVESDGNTPSLFYFGSTPASRLYMGDTLLWEA